MNMSHLIKTWVLLCVIVLANAMPALGAEDKLTLDAAAMRPGTESKVLLKLQGDTPCYGFQTDLSLPEGLTILKVTRTARTANGVLSANLNAGSERIVLASLSAPLADTEGAVCELTLSASEAFKGGEVVLSHIRMNDGGMSDIELPDSRTKFTLNVETSVEQINAISDLPAEAPIYSLTGSTVGYGQETLLQLPAGIYIVGGRKITVK